MPNREASEFLDKYCSSVHFLDRDRKDNHGLLLVTGHSIINYLNSIYSMSCQYGVRSSVRGSSAQPSFIQSRHLMFQVARKEFKAKPRYWDCSALLMCSFQTLLSCILLIGCGLYVPFVLLVSIHI